MDEKEVDVVEPEEEEKDCLILTSNYKEPTPEPENDIDKK